MKALVISGGGSKGAFAGGIAEYLMNKCGKQYDLFIGTSTGSLLTPLLAIGEVSKLKSIYCGVSQSDIFNINPFFIRMVNGKVTTGINHFNVLRMFLKGKKTFGESLALRELIRRQLSPEEYEKIKLSGREVIVTVSNLTTNEMEYKSAKDCGYDEFCEWMWASCNVVPFMSLFEKGDFQYGDGSMGNHVPIQAAINRGATEIDVIILRTKNYTVKKLKANNAFSLLINIFDFMHYQISKDDIVIGQLYGLNKHVKLNFYYPSHTLTDNSLYFDPKQMTQWWNEGLKYAEDTIPAQHEVKPA